MVELLLSGGFILSAIVSILIISNPVSTSAVFITLTEKMSHKSRVVLAKRSLKYSTGILIFFSLTGYFLFQIFGFSLGAFRIAGGILLFTTGVTMMNIEHSEKHRNQYQDVALIPLSIPFTSGPGTITTVVVLMTEALAVANSSDLATGALHIFGVYIGIAIVIAASYLAMTRSEIVAHHLKEGGRQVITRLMGLMVMAIAIQFIINGIIDTIPHVLTAASAVA